MAIITPQWRRFLRWINPMHGGVKKATPHGILFQYRYRFSGASPVYATFLPNTTSLVTSNTIELSADLCDLDYPGHVLSIILDKPRVREDGDDVVITYLLRVCYTNGGDEVRIQHRMARDTFDNLVRPPEWVVHCTDEKEYGWLDAWLVALTGYCAIPLTESFNREMV